MLSAAFLVQLGLHGLTGALSFAVGAAWGGADGGGTAALALLPLAMIMVAVLGRTIETVWRRTPRAALAERRAADAPDLTRPLPKEDALTGLPNRMAFLERLQAVLDGARRGDRTAAVLCVELVDFAALNQRLDSLQNVIENPYAATIFMVPNMDETLRINGHAWITDDSELLATMKVGS